MSSSEQECLRVDEGEYELVKGIIIIIFSDGVFFFGVFVCFVCLFVCLFVCFSSLTARIPSGKKW